VNLPQAGEEEEERAHQRDRRKSGMDDDREMPGSE
jgi:hypothetical protein